MNLPRRPYLALLILLAAPSAWGQAGENLLKNPGFEQVSGLLPTHWDRFVLDAEGAYARLSDASASGRYAVMLHTATRYPTEPYNNWSQNVFGDLEGETLLLSGMVRTEEAGGAALWVQCWARNPLRIAASVGTGDQHSMRGTMPWQEVETEVLVPPETAFITVRCVLTGVGSAWFDALALEVVEEVLDEPEGEVAEGEEDIETPDAALAPPDEPTEEAAAETTAQQESPEALLDELETELRLMRNANTDLLNDLRGMREQNDALRQQMDLLRRDVNSLRLRTDGTGGTGSELGNALGLGDTFGLMEALGMGTGEAAEEEDMPRLYPQLPQAPRVGLPERPGRPEMRRRVPPLIPRGSDVREYMRR